MKKRDIEIVTIGVYGSTEATFFDALKKERVDTFCDIRQRRGVRGVQYAYVNSKRLQEQLAHMGINYLHLKDLAPTTEIRQRQKKEDERLGVRKRSRDRLGEAFIQAYREEILSSYSFRSFFEALPETSKVVALFCVERAPEACHRSLVADGLATQFGLSVKHVQP